ncbi:MAG: peptidase C14 caspase catalytic subunit p20 [Bacteroidetes bacterium OLB12]|nr:MAG: peptidase C14 caspase catalytic subunit p20 [Bacteroidetes bacterium OLB12]
MKALTVLLVLFCAMGYAQEPEVDLVRLGYLKNETTSEQVGMAASPDGAYAAFAFKDRVVKIFDVRAGRFIKRFAIPFADLFDMQLTNDGKLILAGGKQVVIMDWKGEKTLAQFNTTGEITKSSYSDRANLFAVGQREGWIEIYDLKTLKVINTFQYKKHHVSALALHPNGKSIVVGVIPLLKEMNPLKVFEISSGKVLAESKKGFYTMAAFDEKGENLVVSSLNMLMTKTTVEILNGTSLTLIRDVEGKVVWGNNIMPYSGKISGNKLLAITASLSFNVYDIQSGGISFTTKSDGFKLSGTLMLGVGNAHPYPLGNSGKFLINSLGNNINQIYDIKTNAIVGYFFCDSNDDFAVVSRDGRVEGTPEALRKVFWTSRLSNQRTPLESTFESGFTPRLLSQIVDEDEKTQLAQTTFEVEKVIDKIPALQLKSINGKAASAEGTSATQKQSNVEIAVTQNPQEITEIKLYQNSKLVKVVPGNGKSLYAFDVSLTNSFGEQNYFYATASSKSGVESEKTKFVINYKGATEAKPKLYLVTIGIDKYKNPKYNLNYAQADADGVAKVISQQSKSLFQEVVPFSIRNDKAVKTNIFAALNQVKAKALEQDMIVVYYAGHGVMSGGADKQFYIVPHDITQLYGRDDLLVDKGISANDLKDFASAINAQKQVFILDACQSAGALDALEDRARGAAEEKAIAQLARSTGTFWITSTGAEQFATEFAKLGHGIFTYALLEGINGAADTNKDQRLTIRELSTYIENKVPELSEQLKGSAQFPSAYSFGNDFPLAVFEK